MKKAITLLLVFAMLLPLASCGEAPETVSEEQPAVGSASDTQEASEEQTDADADAAAEEETRPMHKVQKCDFEGADFHTLYPEWQGYKYYFFADESTGDAMNDAIFERRVRVEEYTNTKLTSENGGGIAVVPEMVKTAHMTGEALYDQVLLHCIDGVSALSGGGYLYDYAALPNVDLSAEWWNREMMDMLRLGKGTYFGVSDFMIPCPYAIMFNRDIVENHAMDDPYELVREGTWTFDKFASMAEAATTDSNGDGRITEDDVHGVITEEVSKFISFMTASDQYITDKGEDGLIQLAMNTERTVAIVEKLYELVLKDGIVYVSPTQDITVSDTMFMNGKSLFDMTAVSEIVSFRDADITVGILPYPKFDEAQDGYRSLDWGGLAAIPRNIDNPDMVGAVVELLAYESADTVIPAYYDVLLAGKLSRDENMSEMLDILFDTITYEVGGNYFGFTGGFSDLFYTLGRLVVNNKSNDFSSWYAKNQKSAGMVIKKYYKELEKNEQ